jgi:hypothetical protein
MKMLVGAILVAVCSVALGAQAAKAPPPPPPQPAAMDKAAIEKALIANEQKINDAVLKGDVATFKTMVADDGWSIDDHGAMSVTEFEKQLKPGIAKITDSKLDMFKVLWADPNTAVVTYTWTGKGTFMDQPVHSPTYCSTVWTKRGAKWLAVYHQETPGTAPMPGKK